MEECQQEKALRYWGLPTYYKHVTTCKKCISMQDRTKILELYRALSPEDQRTVRSILMKITIKQSNNEKLQTDNNEKHKNPEKRKHRG